MGKLAKSLKNSIWYASKILNCTRYAEQNWEVRGTPWGGGGYSLSYVTGVKLQQCQNMRIGLKHIEGTLLLDTSLSSITNQINNKDSVNLGNRPSLIRVSAVAHKPMRLSHRLSIH